MPRIFAACQTTSLRSRVLVKGTEYAEIPYKSRSVSKVKMGSLTCPQKLCNEVDV